MSNKRGSRYKSHKAHEMLYGKKDQLLLKEGLTMRPRKNNQYHSNQRSSIINSEEEICLSVPHD